MAADNTSIQNEWQNIERWLGDVIAISTKFKWNNLQHYWVWPSTLYWRVVRCHNAQKEEESLNFIDHIG